MAPQMLKVEVPIQIPDQFRLIEKSELDDLQEQSLLGRTWLMSDLRKWCGNKSPDWIKENILFNPKYSKDMQSFESSGYIFRKGRGSAWKFKASVMAAWLDEHWNELPW